MHGFSAIIILPAFYQRRPYLEKGLRFRFDI